MSDNDSQDQQTNRQPAKRLFASEIMDATHTFQEGESERAPKFSLLPTGDRANRVLLIGTLTNTEDVGNKAPYLKGEVVDPTGTSYVYAGKYQPEGMEALESLETPAYVAVVGKLRTYEGDDSQTFVNVQANQIIEVDAETRDRWVVETAQATVERIKRFRDDDADDEDAWAAEQMYEGGVEEYLEAAIEALESLDHSDELVDEEADAEAPADTGQAEPSAAD